MPPPEPRASSQPSTDPEQFLRNLDAIQLRERTEEDRATAIQTARVQLSITLPPMAALAILYDAWIRWVTVALTRTGRPDVLELVDAIHREPAHLTIGRFTNHHLAFDRFARDACSVYGEKFLTHTAPYAKLRHPAS